MIGPMQHLDSKTLKQLRRRLLEEKQRILRSLRDLLQEEERWGDMTQEPMDLEDWAHFSYSEELLARLSTRELDLLRAIDRALQQMDNGTYGICESCGKPIEPERLELIPWTNVCAECARKYSS